MNVNLDAILSANNTSVEIVAGHLGMFVADNEVIPQGTVTVAHFKKILGEYLAESLESGENLSYTLERLAA